MDGGWILDLKLGRQMDEMINPSYLTLESI